MAKPTIVAIASEALQGKLIEHIIEDFELGNIPQLDNTTVQMALVAIADEMEGNIFIEKAVAEESAPSFGKLQSIGLRAFCETIVNIPVNISTVEHMVNQDIFEKATTDKYEAKISKLLESREKESVTSSENVELKNLDDFHIFLTKLKVNNLEQTPIQEYVTQPNEGFETIQLDKQELYCNVVLTLALRLCEPTEIHQIVQEYNTTKKIETGTKALQMVKNSLHQKHYTVNDIPFFLHPSDFKPNKIEKLLSMYTQMEQTLQSPLVGTSIRAINPKKSLAQALKAAATISNNHFIDSGLIRC